MNSGLYAVAGATGAIGRQLCLNIKQWGGTPLLIGRCQDKLAKVNDELGGGCPVIADCDFSAMEGTSKHLSDALKGETLQGVAYAVGSITLKPLRGCKVSDFRDSYELNVLGAVELIKAALPGLKKGGSKDSPSSVVLFSSVAASRGLSNHAVIGSSKAAIEGLTVSLAAELSPAIRVNCVAPSLTGGGSEMAKSMTDNEKMAQAIAAAHPLPRLGSPMDSANAAAYLLSNHSAWSTGMILPVDGGRSTILK
jgi:NAD(P)-dependent dehydrogenase (short-subunit alcohol dehydrogenase family)